MERGVGAFARFYREEPGYAELWLASQLVEPLVSTGEAWGRHFAELWAVMLRERAGVAEARAPVMALALVHAISAVITLALRRPARERDRLLNEAVALAKAFVLAG